MKKRILLLLAFALGLSLYAQAQLAPEQAAPLYEHLYEVNKEWATQAERVLLPNETVSFQSDIERIQAHLQWVEHSLRQRDAKNLSQEAQRARMDQLDVLQTYWQEATFPVNRYHSVRQPYFVDHLNTACAVGHLMRESGAEATVQRIHTENNYAYIEELAEDDELLAWADDHGFSVGELAWIQPAYNPISHTARAFGDNQGVIGKVNVMKAQGDLLYFGGDFTSVDGVAANGVIGWDGEEWITYPGLEGEVVDISPGFPIYTRFYVIGSFSLDGVDGPVNVAEWNENDGWIPLQTGDIGGDFYSMHRNGASLMVSGDFQQINGQPMANVAIYGLNEETWNNQGGELVVNGPVYDLTWVNGRFLLAGDFTSVGPDDKSVTNLAYYDFFAAEWLAPPTSEQGPIYYVAFHEGVIYAASDFADAHTFATLSGGLWYYQDYFEPLGLEPGQFHGILTGVNQEPILYGNYISGGIGSTVYGIGTLHGLGYLAGIIVTDKGFRAAAYYKNQLVVAGDFDVLGGNPINQIAIIELVTDVVDPNSDERLAKVYAHADQIYVADLVDHQKAQIDIFSMNGQLLHSATLDQIADTQTLSLPQLSAGTYVYRLWTDKGLQAGKFVFMR